MAVNYFDVAVIVILLLFGIRGCLRGFIGEISGIVGIIGGLYISNRFYPMFADYLTFITSPAWRQIAAYIIVFFLFLLLVGICARVLQRIMSFSFISWVDKLAGFLLGLVKGFILCSLLLLFIQTFLKDAPFMQGSFMATHLKTVMLHIQSYLPENWMDIFPGGAK